MPNEVNPSTDLVDLCQSDFERAVFLALVERGYRVIPQVGSVGFSIDMVVEGDGGRRLAIECDGDQYHGPARWADDMRRQRILERVGWNFWRCFSSNYRIDPQGALEDLVQTLERMKIKPVGREMVNRSFSEHRTVAPKPIEDPDSGRDGSGITVASLRAELEAPLMDDEAGYVLVVGDRVSIRYLDVEPSRPEHYTLSDTADDPINGYLLLASALGQALLQGAPGDELSFKVGDTERWVLFVSLEPASAQAA
jgi:very-short-patch-repair endonuclease